MTVTTGFPLSRFSAARGFSRSTPVGLAHCAQSVRVPIRTVVTVPGTCTLQPIRSGRLCGSGHHHHLVCERCNRVVELGECDLEPWLARLGGTHGFQVTRHSVEVTGICADCA